MNEDEARGLVAAIGAMAAQPSTEDWVLRARQDMERYAAEAQPDGSWCVVVLWRQPPHRFGLRVDEVADVAGCEEATLDEAAVALWAYVEEPHGGSGRVDGDGRAWLGTGAP